ncbi:MAG: RsmB/NOP family class I SAM-dependent RNA methyltransferase [Pseudomonadota bacterium]
MKPGARLASAVEVLSEVLGRHRPVALALSDWGKSNRFAGSGDRSAIGNLVYDVLRRKNSLAAQMQSDTPRALIIAAAPRAFGVSADDVERFADGSKYALSALTTEETNGLRSELSAELSPHIQGDFPEWLSNSLERAFGTQVVAQTQALSTRAPVDLRVNALKATKEQVVRALSKFDLSDGGFAPQCIRLPAPSGTARTPNVEVEAAHGRGWFEVQDEGSQIAAALAGAGPRQQVMDLCAGAGGKTLAFAAQMQNTGQLYAYDADRQQLRPIFERLRRAGARNVQVMDAGDDAALNALGPKFDTVFVDAPCTGSGTWRRRPDTKWRVKPANLATRIAEQQRVLQSAKDLVRPGGRLVYVTCSVLPEENADQVAWFVELSREFSLIPVADQWSEALPGEMPRSAIGSEKTLQLTPHDHQTDGFFIAILERAK